MLSDEYWAYYVRQYNLSSPNNLLALKILHICDSITYLSVDLTTSPNWIASQMRHFAHILTSIFFICKSFTTFKRCVESAKSKMENRKVNYINCSRHYMVGRSHYMTRHKKGAEQGCVLCCVGVLWKRERKRERERVEIECGKGFWVMREIVIISHLLSSTVNHITDSLFGCYQIFTPRIEACGWSYQTHYDSSLTD